MQDNFEKKHHRTPCIISFNILDDYEPDLIQNNDSLPEKIILLGDINQECTSSIFFDAMLVIKDAIFVESAKKLEKNKEFRLKLLKAFHNSKCKHVKNASKEKIFLPVLTQKKNSSSVNPSTARKRPLSYVPQRTKTAHSNSLNFKVSEKKKGPSKLSAVSGADVVKNFHS